MSIIEEQSPYLPLNAFETPESYAQASFWLPENGFSWGDFRNEFANSPEEFDIKLAEFAAKIRGKLEVCDNWYRDKSLRNIFPNRWLVAYSRGAANERSHSERKQIYLRIKNKLLCKSTILGYGEGPIREAVPNGQVAAYIKRHCTSSARLKAIALRAYESIADCGGYTTWTPVSPPIFLCLAAAKSSLDSMAAVLWTLLFHECPHDPTQKLPTIGWLNGRLEKLRHPFHQELVKLVNSSWFTQLEDARNAVIHRSASPVAHDKYGTAFNFDLGLFEETRSLMPEEGEERNLQLDTIMQGFVVGLEDWENTISHTLGQMAWFPSLNKSGILMAIDFNDNRLLRDGSGPCYLIHSRS